MQYALHSKGGLRIREVAFYLIQGTLARTYPIKELLDQTSHQPLFLSSVLVIRMGKDVDSIHRVGSIS